MRSLIAASLSLLLVAPAVAAPGFASRLATAKAAVATRQGFIYDTAMVPAIHHAVVPCVPKGTDPGRGGEFVLVADVDATGHLSAVDVRPQTPFARCFARTFGATVLQPPPPRSGGWPIAVEMETRP
ncbi:hypothetical protein [Lysobacter xanthus]